MAVHWLDAARYGDSSAMHADHERFVGAWRQWVIRAYNRNLPFDRFTVDQLAGDLIPQATVEQQLASAFNRHHPTSNEDGSIPEELRVEYVADRVHTTSTVWLGLTMDCARCHDHKYDPISLSDYYGFFAYFNNGADPGIQNGTTAPAIDAPTPHQHHLRKHLHATIMATSSRVKAYQQRYGYRADYFWDHVKTEQLSVYVNPPGLEHRFPLVGDRKLNLSEAISGVLPFDSSALPPRPIDGLHLQTNTHLAYRIDSPTDSAAPTTLSLQIFLKNRRDGAILSRQSTGSDRRGFSLSIRRGRLIFQVIRDWPNNLIEIETANHIPENRWVSISLTYPASRRPTDARFYINGKSARINVTIENLQQPFTTTAPLIIGANQFQTAAEAAVRDVRFYSRVLDKLEVASLTPYFTAAIRKQPDARDRLEVQILKNFYYTLLDPNIGPDKRTLDRSLRRLETLKANVDVCLIMGDLNTKPRPTYVLDRGMYNAPRKEHPITPSVPRCLHLSADAFPPNRLGLAQWLTHPDNPVVSRVAVNRLWQQLFGEGLVRTPGDFGLRGQAPTHPDLLDWLAVEFVESGWDTKQLIRLIVNSQTYRQASRYPTRNVDPENRLLGRAPRLRLTAEATRDQALALASLLSEESEIRSAKPYQPGGLWAEVHLYDDIRYLQDTGRGLYRRSVHSLWHRSAPLPNMMIFDALSRERCTVRRSRTNTPLQALVTLNDEQFVEAARCFAQVQLAAARPSLSTAFKTATGRLPTTTESAILTDLLSQQIHYYREHPDAASALIAVGEADSSTAGPVELAAWTVVCQALLNLDEVLHRG